MRRIVHEKSVKFRAPSWNHSQEIPLEAVGCGIFDSLFHYNFLSEVDNDVISGVAVDIVGMDVCVKFGDSRSNGFWDIRGADIFMSNKRTWRNLSQ